MSSKLFFAVALALFAAVWAQSDMSPGMGMGNPMANKIGKCTTKQIAEYSKACSMKFFASFRRDPSADCREQYKKQIQCIKKAILRCIKGTFFEMFKDSLMSGIMAGFTGEGSGQRLVEVYCGNEDFKLLPPKELVDQCSKDFIKFLVKDSNDLLKLFRKDRASKDLCGAFKQHQERVEQHAKRDCKLKDNGILSTLFFSKENPFCKDDE